MIKGGGLGSSTLTGLEWELETSFEKFLSVDFSITKSDSQLINKETGECSGIFYLPKNKLYAYLKTVHNVNAEDYISKRLYGDEVILNENTMDLYIIEKKNQNCAGSVDEKIQTCDFKKKQFEKIFKRLGFKVHYEYLLNDWFKQEQYKDALEYIRKVGCNYFFNALPERRIVKILNTTTRVPVQMRLF